MEGNRERGRWNEKQQKEKRKWMEKQTNKRKNEIKKEKAVMKNYTYIKKCNVIKLCVVLCMRQTGVF